MHIIVCIKQILNPDIATTIFRVDEEAKRVALSGHSPVISPFDAQAVEAAMRIKDTGGDGVKITVMTMGLEGARTVLKAGLAMGADEGVLLADAAFKGTDSTTTARVLAAAIRKAGDADLILTGRQAADGDDGVVGLGLAELLDRPAITFAKDIQSTNGMVRVVRVLEDGFETMEAPLPAVVTVAHEIGQPRFSSLRETMRAAKKPVHAWAASDLGLDPKEIGGAGARRIIERLYIPVKTTECEFFEGGTPEDMAAKLAQRLRDVDAI
jgi:electron transfer flavoprotein beta subunit